MREFQAKKKERANFNRILSSKWFLIITLILLFIIIRGNIRVFNNYFNVKKEYDDSIKYYEELKKRDNQLNKDIDRLETDDGLDYEIRKKLDVSKDNENVIKIIEKR